MVRWLEHAFWYTLIGAFALSVVLAIGAMVVSLLLSLVTIALNLPAAIRHWRRTHGLL